MMTSRREVYLSHGLTPSYFGNIDDEVPHLKPHNLRMRTTCTHTVDTGILHAADEAAMCVVDALCLRDKQ